MTDETAQALLKNADAYDTDDVIHLYMEDCGEDGTGYIEVEWLTVPKNDLNAMAQLWFLKDEIEHAVRLVATVSIPHRDLFAKIEALEAE